MSILQNESSDRSTPPEVGWKFKTMQLRLHSPSFDSSRRYQSNGLTTNGGPSGVEIKILEC
ncbi:MAG: hypothetical protein ACTS6P_00955 [Candidatus Hodgkinia cicadicola]